jgi:hypothetical protein
MIFTFCVARLKSSFPNQSFARLEPEPFKENTKATQTVCAAFFMFRVVQVGCGFLDNFGNGNRHPALSIRREIGERIAIAGETPAPR